MELLFKTWKYQVGTTVELGFVNHFTVIHHFIKSWDSVVGIATGYGLDGRGVGSLSPGKIKNFHFSILSRPALGST
jgi:hypothetical protein